MNNARRTDIDGVFCRTVMVCGEPIELFGPIGNIWVSDPSQIPMIRSKLRAALRGDYVKGKNPVMGTNRVPEFMVKTKLNIRRAKKYGALLTKPT